MAERYDERFDELTGLVQMVVGRVDEMQLDMRDMRKDIRDTRNDIFDTRKDMGGMRSELHVHSSRFDKLEDGLNFLSGQQNKVESAVNLAAGKQNDVIPKVIEIQKAVNRISEAQAEQTFKIIEILNRLNVVEILLRSLGDETNGLKLEINEVRSAIHSFIDPVQIGWDLRENIKEIERRVTDIEQKLAN